MDEEVARFEQTILDYADAFGRGDLYAGVGAVGVGMGMGDGERTPEESVDSDASTPLLSPTSLSVTPSSACSREGSFNATQSAHRPSFVTRLNNMLTASLSQSTVIGGSALMDDSDDEDIVIIDGSDAVETRRLAGKRMVEEDVKAAWSVEADGVDRSIRILPGVKKMLESIPEGRYAVATSGAKTYGTTTNSNLG